MPSGILAGSRASSGQRSTDPIGSGRFCPESGSPCIECIGDPTSGADCAATKVPDSLLASKLPKGREGEPYVPVSLPPSFGASSEAALGSIVLERIGRIFPETGTKVAIKYLREASIALSFFRSYQGITASSSKELVPFFDSVLKGDITEKTMGYLERAISRGRESPLEGTNSMTRADRVKAAFHLARAATLRLPT